MKEIELTKNKKVIVDDDWYQVLKKFKWYAHESNRGKWYACRNIGRKGKELIFMHRYITLAPKHMVVDHINGDGLDNREENLRVVRPKANYYNRSIQANNTTGYKGVCWDKGRQKYFASISVDHKQINLGRYETAKEAGSAYNEAALKYYGEMARLNDV